MIKIMLHGPAAVSYIGSKSLTSQVLKKIYGQINVHTCRVYKSLNIT